MNIRELSEEIHEKKDRLHHYMNLEVNENFLLELKEEIKKKQMELLKMIEDQEKQKDNGKG